MKSSERIIITKFKNGIRTEELDQIVIEGQLKLAVNHKELTSLICTPSDLKELAAGYLVTSGIVSSNNKLVSLRFDEKKFIMHCELEDNSVIKDMIFSKLKPVGCGDGLLLFTKNIKSEISNYCKASSENIINVMKEFNKSSELFLSTGGVHSAGISDGKKIIVVKEDIGRHNAFDKVIGYCRLNDIDLKEKVMLTSGRISSEIMRKGINSGLEIIISRSAPTEESVKMAKESNITLIGFARSNGFNIYTNNERIIG